MDHITQANEAPEAPKASSIKAAAAARKAKRVASLSDMGISSYGRIERDDTQLLISLVETHPRQFWNAVKRPLTDRMGDERWELFRAFEGKEALLRAGLWLTSKNSRIDGVGRNESLQRMLAMTLALPGKREGFYLSRVEAAKQQLSQVSAGDVFFTITAPAIAGNAAATLALAKLMPDANSADKQEARRHTYGQTSFAGSGMHDQTAMSKSLAFIRAQVKGKPAEKPEREKICSNPFFWIAHRYLECSKAKSPEAALWREAGEILIRRCPKMGESTEALPLLIGIEPFRKVLMETRPTLGSPSFYCFHRDEIILDALRLSSKKETAEVIAYANTGERPVIRVSAAAQGGKESSWLSSGFPAWALALLAGRAPDPAWMPAPDSEEAKAEFSMPKALAEKAKAGSVKGRDVDSGRFPSGTAKFNAARLCKALGHAWEAQPEPAPAKPAARKPRAKGA
jgi:hypothetical protein